MQMRSNAGMDNKILLGKRLRELRLRKGLSQEKLAELAKIEPIVSEELFIKVQEILDGKNLKLPATTGTTPISL